MEPKITSIRMNPEVHKRLKIMSVQWEKPIGDIIAAFVFLQRQRQIPETLFKQALAHVARPGFSWEGDDPEGLKAKFRNLRDTARDAGDEATAKRAEEKLAALDREYPGSE